MSVLFSDLDNTLIYSHHRDIGDHKITVEYYEGREQSFMTKYSYDFFTSVDWLHVIPVTTRTEEQYRRIDNVLRSKFKYAIVCNGGKLIVDDKEDEEWSHETYICTRDNYESLEDATIRLSSICKESKVHRPEKYMSYVKCNNPEMVFLRITEYIDDTKVSAFYDNRKVYIFAKGISKGNAVGRFVKKMKYDPVIVAGDSNMDVSMLEKADYAFTDSSIYNLLSNSHKYLVEDNVLSDGICRYLHDMRIELTK